MNVMHEVTRREQTKHAKKRVFRFGNAQLAERQHHLVECQVDTVREQFFESAQNNDILPSMRDSLRFQLFLFVASIGKEAFTAGGNALAIEECRAKCAKQPNATKCSLHNKSLLED